MSSNRQGVYLWIGTKCCISITMTNVRLGTGKNVVVAGGGYLSITWLGWEKNICSLLMATADPGSSRCPKEKATPVRAWPFEVIGGTVTLGRTASCGQGPQTQSSR